MRATGLNVLETSVPLVVVVGAGLCSTHPLPMWLSDLHCVLPIRYHWPRLARSARPALVYWRLRAQPGRPVPLNRHPLRSCGLGHLGYFHLVSRFLRVTSS